MTFSIEETVRKMFHMLQKKREVLNLFFYFVFFVSFVVISSSWEAGMPAPTFVAIDFETADHGADSACAVGESTAERERIAKRSGGVGIDYVVGSGFHHAAEPGAHRAGGDPQADLLPALDAAHVCDGV